METIRSLTSPTTGQRLILDIAPTNEDCIVKPTVTRALAHKAYATHEQILAQRYKNPEGGGHPTLQRSQFKTRGRPLIICEAPSQTKTYSQAAQQQPPKAAKASTTTTTASITDNISGAFDTSPTLTQVQEENARLKRDNNKLTQQLVNPTAHTRPCSNYYTER
jgi:hypothetical protein